MKKMSLEALIDEYQSLGQYSFSKEEIFNKLGSSDAAFYKAAERLAKKNRILRVVSGFYIIVPLEYLRVGTLPPTWYIAKLMSYLEVDFYVGLLSAASIHGAAHHAPQIFQVVTNKQMRPLILKGHEIHFYRKEHFSLDNCVMLDFPTGKCRVSNPALTAVDLVRNYKNCGYMDNVATVLSELLEEVTESELSLILENNDIEITVAKRLGYLMDFLGFSEKSVLLHQWLQKFKPRISLLINEKGKYGFEINKKWGLIINEEIEADI